MRSTKESTNQSVLLGCIYGGGFLHNYPMIAIFMYSPLNSSFRPLLMCIFIETM